MELSEYMVSFEKCWAIKP
jgi:hypothetical protein